MLFGFFLKSLKGFVSRNYYTSERKETSWFCIRCGNKLRAINKSDDSFYKEALLYRLRYGTKQFLCSNDHCCHSDAPLTLHHPSSYKRSAGDSYSISWIR